MLLFNSYTIHLHNSFKTFFNFYIFYLYSVYNMNWISPQKGQNIKRFKPPEKNTSSLKNILRGSKVCCYLGFSGSFASFWSSYMPLPLPQDNDSNPYSLPWNNSLRKAVSRSRSFTQMKGNITLRSAENCQRPQHYWVHFCLDDKANLDLFIVVQFSQKKNHFLIPWTCLKLVHQFRSCWGVGQGNKKVISNTSPFFKLKISVWDTVFKGYLKQRVQKKW